MRGNVRVAQESLWARWSQKAEHCGLHKNWKNEFKMNIQVDFCAHPGCRKCVIQSLAAFGLPLTTTVSAIWNPRLH